MSNKLRAIKGSLVTAAQVMPKRMQVRLMCGVMPEGECFVHMVFVNPPAKDLEKLPAEAKGGLPFLFTGPNGPGCMGNAIGAIDYFKPEGYTIEILEIGRTTKEELDALVIRTQSEALQENDAFAKAFNN